MNICVVCGQKMTTGEIESQMVLSSAVCAHLLCSIWIIHVV